MNTIRFISVFCLAWVVTAHVLPAYVEGLLSARGISPADAWSESFLEDGTRVVTFHNTGESFRAGAVSTVTQEKARELGFPDYDGSPLNEAVAGDVNHSPLSKRAVRERIYDGIAVANCPITGTNTRPIVVKSKLYEELHSLEILPVLGNINSVYVPHGTEISWEEHHNGAVIKPNLVARVSKTVVLSGTPYCCNVVWGWLQPFDAEDYAEEGVDDPDFLVQALAPERERAEEVCYVMTANRCYHDSRVQRNNCQRIIIRWWN